MTPAPRPGTISGMQARRRELLVDLGPVLLLAAVTTLALVRLRDGAPGQGEVLFSLAVWVPALARRYVPVHAFVATALLVVVHWFADGLAADALLPADIALWFALVGLAERRSAVTAAVATGVCGALALATLLGSEDVGERHEVVPLSAMTLAAVLWGRNRRARHELLADLRERAELAERERDQLARVAVAEERTRIAREVHDVVSHNVSVMTALADGAGYALRSDADRTQAQQAVAAIATTGRRALAEMHRLLGVLRSDGEDGDPSRHPTPGLSELPALVEQVRAAGLPTTLTVTGLPVHLGTTAQLAVYRLVQEALTNTRRHAPDAGHAEVQLVWADGGLTVRVRDDGGTTTGYGDHGMGLIGMRERIGAHGGRVSAGRQAQGGWLVEAFLPVQPLVDAA